MKEVLHKKAYIVLFHLYGVLEQTKLVSGDKPKQWLGVDDAGLTVKEQRGLSEVMEVSHILIREGFIG